MYAIIKAVVPIAIGTVGAAVANAATLTTLYKFAGTTDGAYPASALVAGPDGKFYGTTLLGGSGCGGTGCGTIFQLAPPAAGATKWTLTTLFRFGGGSDGEEPMNLVVAPNGVLYGVAMYGGIKTCTVGGAALGCGTVFTLIPPVTGTSWTFYALYQFTGGADGKFPSYGLARDAAGNLYGTAYSGGTCTARTCGTVFRLSAPTGSQTTWQLKTLHAFTGGTGGSEPYGTPLLDAAGNVYASASLGGNMSSAMCSAAGGCGVVVKMTPPVTGSTWGFSKVWTFAGTDGLAPQGHLSADAAGNIFGVTYQGGDTTSCAAAGTTPPGCGAVVELSPPAAGATKWTRKILLKLDGGADGLYPDAGLTASGSTYYLTTSGNGIKGFGSILKLMPPAAGQTAWTRQTLYTFENDDNGAQPAAAMLSVNGTLYGTTLGHDGPAVARYGTIFKLVP